MTRFQSLPKYARSCQSIPIRFCKGEIHNNTLRLSKHDRHMLILLDCKSCCTCRQDEFPSQRVCVSAKGGGSGGGASESVNDPDARYRIATVSFSNVPPQAHALVAQTPVFCGTDMISGPCTACILARCSRGRVQQAGSAR
eukprot:2228391-Rhodomonas_salina.2